MRKVKIIAPELSVDVRPNMRINSDCDLNGGEIMANIFEENSYWEMAFKTNESTKWSLNLKHVYYIFIIGGISNEADRGKKIQILDFSYI